MRFHLILVAALTLLASQGARAEKWWSVIPGVKFYPGLVIQERPNIPDDYNWDAKKGYSGGGGPFCDVIFFDWLGLELDIFFESSKIVGRFSRGNSDIHVKQKFFNVRIPFLVKLVIPTGSGAMPWIGTGPEFVIGTSASVEQRVDNGSPREVEQYPATYFHWAFGGGLNIDLGWVTLPVEIRGSINLNEKEYDETDIANIYPSLKERTVKLYTSWDLRMSMGFAYRF